jgi:hypothetical protein
MYKHAGSYTDIYSNQVSFDTLRNSEASVFVYVQNFIIFIRQTTFHQKLQSFFSMEPPDQ